MPEFYDGQPDYIPKLNEMAEAFRAGPFDSVPKTGGVMSGPLGLEVPLDPASGGTGADSLDELSKDIGYTLPAPDAVLRKLADKLALSVDIFDFGVVSGLGVTDAVAAANTVRMQKALDYCAANFLVLHAYSAIVCTSGPLSGAHGGLVFDQVSLSAGIWPRGSGYTALTWTGRPSQIYVSVNGVGNNVNGVLFKDLAEGEVQRVRTYNLGGFHIKRDNCWDVKWGALSAELNTRESTEYMFIEKATSAESNMSPTGRWQVEQCMNGRAVDLEPNSLSQTWLSGHCERALPVPGVPTFILGGNRALYMNLRLGTIDDPVNTSVKSTDGLCFLVGGNTTYENLSTEGGFPVEWDASAGGQLTLITPQIDGVLRKAGAQYGRLNVIGGNAAVETDRRGYALYGLRGTQGVAFTPQLVIGGSPTGVASTAPAEWTIEGTLLHMRMTITLTSKGANSSGVAIVGIPFKMRAAAPDYAFPVFVENVAFAGTVFGVLINNTDYLTLYRQVANGTKVPLMSADIADDSVFRMALQYPIA